MKRLIPCLLALHILLSACGAAEISQGDMTPQNDISIPADNNSTSIPAAETGAALSVVQELAAEVVYGLDVSTSDGEAAVRRLYRHLVETVCFADPVGFYAWRYLPGADPDRAIPYLENRALGPLLFDVGSCEDFAAAMTLLLRAAGFEAEYVSGFTVSADGHYVDHAWTVIKLDGQWYHLDPQLEQNVTRKGELTYRYYLKGDASMLADHRWGDNLISFWEHMPTEEKAVIREHYTPPACPGDYPPPAAERVNQPTRPDLATIHNSIDALKAQSGLDALPPIPLNVEPPILVAEHHITPAFDVAEASGGMPPGYGRSFLTGATADLYDNLATIARLGRYKVSYDRSLAGGEINAAVTAFLNDRPEFYYLSIDPDDDNPLTLSLGYASGFTESSVAAQRVAVAEVEVAILGAVYRERDLFRRVQLIHDYLSGSVAYDAGPTDDNSGNIYGALVRGKAFCEGYARAFQYLCHRAGYECVYIEGSNPQGVPHAWNAVKIEGDWYYVDATWDRPLEVQDDIYHDYFLITYDEMLVEHRPDSAQYPMLPEAHSPGYYECMNYAVEGQPGDNATARLGELLARQLADRADTLGPDPAPAFLEVKVLGGEEDFYAWKSHFLRALFDIQREMDVVAHRDGLPFDINFDTSVQCHFNAITRVITFYPKVCLNEEDTP